MLNLIFLASCHNSGKIQGKYLMWKSITFIFLLKKLLADFPNDFRRTQWTFGWKLS